MLFLLIVTMACSTHNISQREKPKILGLSSWSDWKAKTGWNEAYQYIPENFEINILKTIIRDNHSFVIFGTTFCDDCKEHIPIIMKILNLAEVTESKIKLYGIDYDLTEPSGYYKKFQIPSTPCLFILESDEIIGNVSYPHYNWLEEITKILKK